MCLDDFLGEEFTQYEARAPSACYQKNKRRHLARGTQGRHPRKLVLGVLQASNGAVPLLALPPQRQPPLSLGLKSGLVLLHRCGVRREALCLLLLGRRHVVPAGLGQGLRTWAQPRLLRSLYMQHVGMTSC